MIVLENGLPIATEAGDVINSARVFYADGAYPIGIMSRHDRNIKTKDLTLLDVAESPSNILTDDILIFFKSLPRNVLQFLT